MQVNMNIFRSKNELNSKSNIKLLCFVKSTIFGRDMYSNQRNHHLHNHYNGKTLDVDNFMLILNLSEKDNIKIGYAHNASSSASFFGILIAACGKESDQLLG